MIIDQKELLAAEVQKILCLYAFIEQPKPLEKYVFAKKLTTNIATK